jgi:hypothetical protein
MTSKDLSSRNNHWYLLLAIDCGKLDKALGTKDEGIIQPPRGSKTRACNPPKPEDFTFMHMIGKYVDRSSRTLKDLVNRIARK